MSAGAMTKSEKETKAPEARKPSFNEIRESYWKKDWNAWYWEQMVEDHLLAEGHTERADEVAYNAGRTLRGIFRGRKKEEFSAIDFEYIQRVIAFERDFTIKHRPKAEVQLPGRKKRVVKEEANKEAVPPPPAPKEMVKS